MRILFFVLCLLLVPVLGLAQTPETAGTPDAAAAAKTDALEAAIAAAAEADTAAIAATEAEGGEAAAPAEGPASAEVRAAVDGAPAPAAPAPAAAPVQETKVTGTPVLVEHTGSDILGARLAFALKEILARSAQFRVTAGNEKKLLVLLGTKEEFPGRPGLGSVYTAVFCYSESEATLKYHLDNTGGVVQADGVDDLARLLANRTAEVAARFAYLY